MGRKRGKRGKRFIYEDKHVDTFEASYGQKPVWIDAHVIKRARQRGIAWPDQVYAVIKTGKVKRFGKNRMKFIKRSKEGSIICIGLDMGHSIIIKTIERGN